MGLQWGTREEYEIAQRALRARLQRTTRPVRERVAVYRDRNDWWVGYYRGETHHYVCPLPTLVVRWKRRVDVSYRDWTKVVIDGQAYAARGRILGSRDPYSDDIEIVAVKDPDSGEALGLILRGPSQFVERGRTEWHADLAPMPRLRGWPGWEPWHVLYVDDTITRGAR